MERFIIKHFHNHRNWVQNDENPQNCLGAVLTVDILPIYINQVKDNTTGEIKDVVTVVLLWTKEDPEYKEKGSVLPGKKDRAYSKIESQDISVEDAMFQLVERN